MHIKGQKYFQIGLHMETKSQAGAKYVVTFSGLIHLFDIRGSGFNLFTHSFRTLSF